MDAQIWWILSGHYTAPGSYSPLVLSSFILLLFAPLLYLVQLTHLLYSLPDDEESLILTGVEIAVNQHMLSQHALIFLFDAHSVKTDWDFLYFPLDHNFPEV